MKFALLIIASYLLGSVPAAYIAGRLSKGIDIRDYGSGNVGGSNLMKVVPKQVAAIAFVYDVVKGFIPPYLSRIFGLSLAEQITVGLAAIAGHNWPVFLRFNGGRGIATTLGVTIFIMPRITVILLAIVLLSILFHAMAVATIIALFGFPLSGAISGLPLMKFFLNWSLNPAERPYVTLALLGIPLIAVIRRLLAPKSEFTNTVNPRELFFNRLFFDRDVRDGKAWVTRNMDRLKEKR